MKVSLNQALQLWSACRCECPHSATSAVNDLLGIKRSGTKRRKSKAVSVVGPALVKQARKKPEKELQFVKSQFVLRGDTLGAWGRRNGFNSVHVLRSVRGDYHGPKAKRVIDGIRCELGI